MNGNSVPENAGMKNDVENPFTVLSTDTNASTVEDTNTGAYINRQTISNDSTSNAEERPPGRPKTDPPASKSLTSDVTVQMGDINIAGVTNSNVLNRNVYDNDLNSWTNIHSESAVDGANASLPTQVVPAPAPRSPVVATLAGVGTYYGRTALKMAGSVASTAVTYARSTTDNYIASRANAVKKNTPAASENDDSYLAQQKNVLASTPSLTTADVPLVARKDPINEEEWYECFNEEGQIISPEFVRSRVFTGGCANDIVRRSMWEFLLGVYRWSSTYEDRENESRKNRRQYYELLDLLNAMELTPEEAESMEQIDKDVIRTDRELPFYGDPNDTLDSDEPLPINLQKLRNILGVYSVIFNPKLPYIQGMNEYASAMLYIQQGEESDAFWCYVKLMQFMGDFFLPEDKTVMNRQFQMLMQLVGDHSPKLYVHLASHECTDVIFAYSWILLNMKRQFPFEESVKVFETTWSMPMKEYQDNRINLGNNPYVLFLALAVFDIESKNMESMDYGEILMHMNTLSGKMDLDLVLSKAEELFWKFVRGSVPEGRLINPTSL